MTARPSVSRTQTEVAACDRLPMASIVVDAAMQSRACGLRNNVVEQYRIAVRNARIGAAPLPPVTVTSTDGLLLLADGFHRHRAHALEGETHISALVLTCASRAEAEWIAAKGNLAHGLQLNKRDRRAAFKRFMRARMHTHADQNVSRQIKAGRPKPGTMTLGEIAGIVGASKSSVRKWLANDFPAIYRDLYARIEDYPRNCGEHLEPYTPFRGDTPIDIARTAFVNAGAALDAIKEGPLLAEYVAALSELISRLKEQHGAAAIQAALDAGWEVGWFHKPAANSGDF